MRIVHVAPFYYPVVGGVEEVVQRVAEYMASRGHEVYVVTYNRWRSGRRACLPRKEVINGVEVVRVKPDFVWSHGTYSSEVPRVIEELKPELVHVHVWRHPHVFQIADLKNRLRFKAILHMHAPYHTFRQLGAIAWMYHRFVDTFFKDVIGRYDRVVALTPYEYAVLTRRFEVEPERVVIIPNGVDEKLLCMEVLESNSAEPIVLYLGRISKAKNVDLLVKAMEYVEVGAELVLAGPDEGLIDGLMSYARRKGLNVSYVGYVSEKDKYGLIGKAAVLAHPSIYEPFGITLIEAQALGKPCIVTGMGGQLYVAPPGRTSLYAEPNPRSFGRSISRLLTDRELYRKLSTNAREWARLFTWTRILPMYEKLYRELIR